MEPLTAGVGCLSVYAGAYFSEIIRGAILSVPQGQSEAAQALGLPGGLIMRRIIFPQMLGYLIPPMTNMGMTLIKESSVLSVITLAELTYIGQFVIGKAFAPVGNVYGNRSHILVDYGPLCSRNADLGKTIYPFCKAGPNCHII